MLRFLRPSLLAMALAAAAAAQDTFSRDELQQLEAEKAAAEARLAALEAVEVETVTDIAEIDARLIAATMESRRREEQASAAELRLIDLRLRLTSARVSLLEDEAGLEELLAALVSAGQRRPPALAVSPGRANDAVRAAVIMGDAAPQLAERADALAGEIARLNRLERDIRRERARLEAAEAVLAVQQLEIEQLAAVKRAQYVDVAADAEALRRRVAELSGQAETIRELLTALEAEAPRSPARKPDLSRQFVALSETPTLSDASPPRIAGLAPLGAAAAAGLRRPAAGLLVRGFGDQKPGGARHEGLTFETRRNAQVMAPADAVIEFAQDFRSYGPTLILRTSDDYHIILSGLGVIYGGEGQSVRAGEPVGRMADRRTPPPELYMELRLDGTLLDPAKWISAG